MLLGLTGLKGCGKTSAAMELHRNHNFKPVAFADPLKCACRALFSFSEFQMEDRVLKEAVDKRWGFSPRYAMQRLGTELMRELFGQDFWIRALEMKIEEDLRHGENVVVGDVRFDNEAEWIRKNNGFVIRIKRPCEKDEQKTDTHISEAQVQENLIDATVVNDSTKFYLGEACKCALVLASSKKKRQMY
jgi:hypothetical protein